MGPGISYLDRDGTTADDTGRRRNDPAASEMGLPRYLAAVAMRAQSAICTRPTSTYLPFSGRKTDASPSFTSNQSLPSASRMFGLWVTRTVLVPDFGAVASSLRMASARRLFSLGDTTRPPSVRSAVFSMSVKPAIV